MMPFIRAGNLNVFYIEHGIGRPIIFVHGNWATGSWWEPLLAKLPDGLRGIACDMRGRGRTGGPDSDYSIPSLAADLKAFAEAMRLDWFHVVGHSLGSAVAMQFALDHPEQVHTLTVVAPAWVDGWEAKPIEEDRQRELKANRNLFDSTMKSLFPTVQDDHYWKRLLDEGHEQRLEAAVGVIRAFDTWKPGNLLQSIQCPKLVIGGEKDLLSNAQIVGRATEALDARLVVMPGVGHGPNIEATEAFLALLLSQIMPGRARNQSPMGS